MKIEVTQRHIDRGIRCDAAACPIAIAIEEACPICEWVCVGINVVTVRIIGDGRFDFRLPTKAQKFVSAFDGGNAEPFSFNLPLESEADSVREPLESVAASY